MKLYLCITCGVTTRRDRCVMCGESIPDWEYIARPQEDYASGLKPSGTVHRGWTLARASGRSFFGGLNKIGITRSVTGPLEECAWGLHWSPTIKEALLWIPSGVLVFRVLAWGTTRKGEGKRYSRHRLPIACLNLDGLLGQLDCSGRGGIDWELVENLALELIGE